jgi:uncharacterized repeat protein (TIGR01451 family)
MRKPTWKKRLVYGVCGTFILALLLAAFPAVVMAQPSLQVYKVALDVNGGTVKSGDVISYVVTITNTGDMAQADDPSLREFVDPIPAHTIYVPGTVTANSGTAAYNLAQNRIEWDGVINTGVANSVVIQFSVAIVGASPGDAISNQGSVNWDSDGNGTSDAVKLTDDPATILTPNDPTVLTVGESQSVRATKTVTDTGGGQLVPGDTLQYTVILSNLGAIALADNAGYEFSDAIPADTTYVEGSLTSSAGTAVYDSAAHSIVWDGIVPALGAVTISFQVTVDPDTPNGTVISNQGTHNFDSGATGTNDASQLTDDPGQSGNADPTTVTVTVLDITASKTVTDLNGGKLQAGETIRYDIALRNGESFVLGDNAGNEFTDSIPLNTTYVTDSATGGLGTVAYNATLNRIEWNGVIAAGGTVDISFEVRVNDGTADNTLISNQGIHYYDTDSNGTNDALQLTDDPSRPGAADATTITVNPTTVYTWYLAEGCTDGGFETYVLVQNPDVAAVHVSLRFQTDQGEQTFPELQDVEVPALSRITFPVHDYLTTYNVSTMVESTDGKVVCERSVYFNNRAGGHDSIGVTAPAATWYLAEGCTDGGFETYVLVQNPSASDVHVNLTLNTDQGQQLPLGLQNQLVPAGGRVTFPIHDYFQSYNVSTIVNTVEVGAEVVCERAVYWKDRKGGSDSVGVTATAATWYLAEGATAGGFETWVLVQNPGLLPVNVNLKLQTATGEQTPTGLQNQTIPAGGRVTFPIHQFLQSYDVSTLVECTDGQVVCERSMYWNNQEGGHDSIGATSTSAAWYLAEGCTAGGFQTWVLVQNPGTAAVTVNLKLQTDTGEQAPTALQGIVIPAGGRVSFPIHAFVQSYNVSTYVECTDGQVIAERAVYWNQMIEGTDSIGVPGPL